MRRTLQAVCLSSVLLVGLTSTSSIQACPMCKAALANSEDPAVAARPKAYMYSILFMISMPATLATLFGISFYRMSRQQQAINAALLAQYNDNTEDRSTEIDADFSA